MDYYIGVAFADMVADLLQNELCPEFDSGLLHGFMGISSESGELLSKYSDFSHLDTISILVELSDLLHFAQMLMGQLDLPLEDVLKEEHKLKHDNQKSLSEVGFDMLMLKKLAKLAGASSELLNRYKKFIFYHGESFTKEEILVGLGEIFHYVLAVAYLLGSNIDELMVINMAKLEARYPNGYSHDKAITHKRDKEKERKKIVSALNKYRIESFE